MAKEKKDKKKGEAEIKLQRVYNIPLRKLTMGTPRYRKAKRCISAMKTFLARHMKADEKNIKIGEHLNEKIWERSIRNIHHHVKVNVTKDADGMVKAELFGAPIEVKAEDKKKKPVHEKKETPAEEKAEEQKKEKLDKAKKIEKEEIDLLKKEQTEHLDHKSKSASSIMDTEKKKEKTVERKVFAEAKQQRP